MFNSSLVALYTMNISVLVLLGVTGYWVTRIGVALLYSSLVSVGSWIRSGLKKLLLIVMGLFAESEVIWLARGFALAALRKILKSFVCSELMLFGYFLESKTKSKVMCVVFVLI